MVEFGKLHYVSVGPGGTFKASGVLATTPTDVDALFDHWREVGAKKITIYFHGGLVSEMAGLDIAKRMWMLFKDQSQVIGFVWKTGAFETIRTNLYALQKTQLFQKVIKYTIRHAAAQLGGGIGDKGPGEIMTMPEIEAELAAAGFDQFDDGARGAAGALAEDEVEDGRAEIEAELEVDLEADPQLEQILEQEAPFTELLDKNFVAEIQNEEAKGLTATIALAKHLAEIVVRVVLRFIRKHDHGFYPTVVEETLRELYLADLGAWVWGGMKRTALDMWAGNEPVISEDSHVGTYFLEKLATLQNERPELVVDLVGHSAGSIAICHMLQTAAQFHPAVAFRNVLFLAPACTSQLFKDEIIGGSERFKTFRMFTMSDDLEIKDRLVPGVYTRSLLYLISGILEEDADTPIVGLELHSRGKPPFDSPTLMTVHKYLYEDGFQRLILSEILGAEAGLNSSSHSHGAFDDDATTQESLLAIVSN